MFKNKLIVITGAGSGIGQALAVQLAARGAQLALADLRSAGLAEMVARLPAGHRAVTYTLYVSSQGAVFGLADTVQKEFGTAHYIFKNAGTSVIGSFEHIALAEVEKVLARNYLK